MDLAISLFQVKGSFMYLFNSKERSYHQNDTKKKGGKHFLTSIKLDCLAQCPKNHYIKMTHPDGKISIAYQ